VRKRHIYKKISGFEILYFSYSDIINEFISSLFLSFISDIKYYFIILFFICQIKKINSKKKKWGLGIGDWGLGIGDWGLGIGPNPQSPFFFLEFIFFIWQIKNNIIK